MAKEKSIEEMTIDSPEFQKFNELSMELAESILDFMHNKGFSVVQGLSVMAGATIDTLSALAEVTEVEPNKVYNSYLKGLQEGFKEMTKK